jgi:class 3 adenylate cyclase
VARVQTDSQQHYDIFCREAADLPTLLDEAVVLQQLGIALLAQGLSYYLMGVLAMLFVNCQAFIFRQTLPFLLAWTTFPLILLAQCSASIIFMVSSHSQRRVHGLFCKPGCLELCWKVLFWTGLDFLIVMVIFLEHVLLLHDAHAFWQYNLWLYLVCSLSPCYLLDFRWFEVLLQVVVTAAGAVPILWFTGQPYEASHFAELLDPTVVAYFLPLLGVSSSLKVQLGQLTQRFLVHPLLEGSLLHPCSESAQGMVD